MWTTKKRANGGRKSWRELWGDGMIGLVCAVKYPEDKGKRMLMEWRPSPNHAKWSEKKKDQREEKKPTWVKSGTIDCITSIVDKVGSGWFVRFGGTKLLSGKAEAELPIAWLSDKDSTYWKFYYSWGEPLYCGSILMTISKELCMFCWVGILHKGGRSHVGKTMAEELEVEPLYTKRDPPAQKKGWSELPIILVSYEASTCLVVHTSMNVAYRAIFSLPPYWTYEWLPMLPFQHVL